MKIKNIKIKNFKSIKNIDFDPSELCALVGANSSGKSNILKAINILLGETYPTERAF
ncbi:AAA family ATPase [Candidatus Gracilibacteria bacterium]|nr:AAA family ATPase [Candidatus Gracilibacteria bacterium]NJS41927.1 AAA family ATPase [Candidatus Gracilibacteria bacterium]